MKIKHSFKISRARKTSISLNQSQNLKCRNQAMIPLQIPVSISRKQVSSSNCAPLRWKHLLNKHTLVYLLLDQQFPQTVFSKIKLLVPKGFINIFNQQKTKQYWQLILGDAKDVTYPSSQYRQLNFIRHTDNDFSCITKDFTSMSWLVIYNKSSKIVLHQDIS